MAYLVYFFETTHISVNEYNNYCLTHANVHDNQSDYKLHHCGYDTHPLKPRVQYIAS